MRNVDGLRHAGVTLAVEEYNQEFGRAFETAVGPLWKLERAQTFYEPDVASWRAMMDGDWDRALALGNEMGRALRDFYRTRPAFQRVRIVERAVTPYLQWEMHILAARAGAGEQVRVVPAESVREWEPLPELLILSESLMYEVLYDEIGGHAGGRRVTDPAVIGPWLALLRDLWDRGEELLAYHEREIAPLPPPRVTDEMRHAVPDYSTRTETFKG
ncbi:hypothetical protein Sme01_64940 [Sphaerisporangium melleum]|uniref:DUF6879 domain-containing protein n=1 Tax=Sphaerisporangium melleum TaxID=321316 RepID=A0A917VP74_9ACTN|nr:DUF6879 family protein [Sphaerisporangium melleum]GGL03818.1 hypothetical protein GCM10007964_52370 [Sphaerisporangium melleum]GII74018.1 hypothetical protein Sme01_64940 [Sphaerisporangium melleum]